MQGVVHCSEGGCPFTGRVVCSCVYGSAILTGASPSAAEHMQRARAALRLLHHPTVGCSGGANGVFGSTSAHTSSSNEPVVIMLPKLTRHITRASRLGPAAAGAPSAHAAAALPAPTAAAAAARVQQLEATVHAAALHAASLAAAAGLAYTPPGGVPIDMAGITKVDHSDLERQVEAVHMAQEARQQAAAAAAAAARQQAAAAVAGAGSVLPVVVPITSPMAATALPLAATGAATAAAARAVDTPEVPSALTAGSADQQGQATPAGRPARRTRSLEPAAVPEAALPQAHSLPLPAAGATKVPKRPAGRPPGKGAAAAAKALASPDGKPAGSVGRPRGKAAGSVGRPRGKAAAAAKQAAAAAAQQQAAQQQQQPASPSGMALAEGAAEAAAAVVGTPGSDSHPDLLPFGEGYQPRGASTTAPPKSWRLKVKDFRPALQGKLVQTFWSDGGQWWPAVVLSVSVAERKCSLYYETGDEETVEFPQLIQAGEVAWLLGPPPAPAKAASAEGGSRGRRNSRQQSPSQQSGRSSDQQQHTAGTTAAAGVSGAGASASAGGEAKAAAARGVKRQRSTAAGPKSPAGASSPPSVAPRAGSAAAPAVPLPSNGTGLSSGGLVPADPSAGTSSEQLLIGSGGGGSAVATAAVSGGTAPTSSLGGGGASKAGGSVSVLTWRSDGLSLQQQPGLPARLQSPNFSANGNGSAHVLPIVSAAGGGGGSSSGGKGLPRPQSEQLLVDTSAVSGLPPVVAEQPSSGQPLSPLQQPSSGAVRIAPAALPGSELPPRLRAAAAALPEGSHQTRMWDLLALGEQAVGRRLSVCTLANGSWQAAVVRQCSGRHGLMQVQLGDDPSAVLLLQAQEDGKAFLLCASAP